MGIMEIYRYFVIHVKMPECTSLEGLIIAPFRTGIGVCLCGMEHICLWRAQLNSSSPKDPIRHRIMPSGCSSCLNVVSLIRVSKRKRIHVPLSACLRRKYLVTSRGCLHGRCNEHDPHAFRT